MKNEDKFNLNVIKIDMVYRSLKDGSYVRTVGWLGKNSVIFESVNVSFSTNLGYFSRVSPRVKRNNRQLTRMTLNKFHVAYREPRPEDADEWFEKKVG